MIFFFWRLKVVFIIERASLSDRKRSDWFCVSLEIERDLTSAGTFNILIFETPFKLDLGHFFPSPLYKFSVTMRQERIDIIGDRVSIPFLYSTVSFADVVILLGYENDIFPIDSVLEFASKFNSTQLPHYFTCSYMLSRWCVIFRPTNFCFRIKKSYFGEDCDFPPSLNLSHFLC